MTALQPTAIMQRCLNKSRTKITTIYNKPINAVKMQHMSRKPRMICNASESPPTTINGTDYDDEAEVEEEEEDDQGAPMASTSYDMPDDDEESRSLAVAIAKIAWETKAEDIMVLHVAPVVYWTRYMVFATAYSKPQLGALLAKATKEAKETFDRIPSGGGDGRSEWELLDYGDVVVHFMTPQQRDYYDLEGFYGAAEEIELPFEEDAARSPNWEKSL